MDEKKVEIGCVCKLRDNFLCEVLDLLEVDGKIANVMIRISINGFFMRKVFPVAEFLKHVVEIYETKWKSPIEAEPVSVEINAQVQRPKD